MRGAELQLLARFAPRAQHRRLRRERMTDEGDRNPGRLVERRLERKQREHPMHRTPDPVHTLAAPRPDRRTDEMQAAHAGALQSCLEAEVEVRGVDSDEQRHALGDETPVERAAKRDELRQPRQHFDESAHGKRFERIPRLAAGRLHPGTRDADEARLRQSRPHGADQRGGQRVARGFAGDDADRHAAGPRERVVHRSVRPGLSE